MTWDARGGGRRVNRSQRIRTACKIEPKRLWFGSALRLLSRDRQIELEPGITRLGADLDAAFVLAHNALHRIQSQTGALAHALGGEKRFEDVRLDIGRNAGTIIANLNHDGAIIAIDSNPQRAFAAHGINRIIDDIGPYLVQFTAERIHQKRDWLIVTLYRHPMLELMVQDSKRSFHAFNYDNFLQRRLVHERIFLDGADQVRDPRRAALDFVQQAGNLQRSRDAAQCRPRGIRIKRSKQ